MPHLENAYHQITRNTAFLFFAQIVTKIIGFVTSLLLANYLDVEHFGTYGFAIAFSSLFIPLCDIGVDTFVVRELAARPERKTEFTGTALLSKAVFSVFAFLVISGAIFSTSYDREKIIFVVLGAGITVLRTFSATFTAFFRGAQLMSHDARSAIVGKIIEIGGLLIGIAYGLSLFQLLLVLLASSFVQLLYTGFVAQRHGFLRHMRLDIGAWNHLLRGGSLFALTGLSVNIYFQIDSVMLSFMAGDGAVGLYRSVYNLVFALSGLSAAFVIAMFPMIAKSHEHDLPRAVQAAKNVIVYSLMLALPIAVGGTVLAESIISTLYRSSFLTASLTLQILVWWIPIVYVTNALGYILGAANLQKIVLAVAFMNAVLNVSLNLVLIPLFRENGAAASTVITESMGLMILAFFVKQRFGLVFDSPKIIRLIFANLVFLPLIFLSPSYSFPLLMIGGGVVYVLFLFALKLLSVEDLQSLAGYLRTGSKKHSIPPGSSDPFG